MLKRLRAYLDDRLDWSRAVASVLDAQVPVGARWSYAFGATIAALFLTEIATGLALATLYAPSAQTAWASVFFIHHKLHWGPPVRAIHYWAAQSMLAVAGGASHRRDRDGQCAASNT